VVKRDRPKKKITRKKKGKRHCQGKKRKGGATEKGERKGVGQANSVLIEEEKGRRFLFLCPLTEKKKEGETSKRGGESSTITF